MCRDVVPSSTLGIYFTGMNTADLHKMKNSPWRGYRSHGEEGRGEVGRGEVGESWEEREEDGGGRRGEKEYGGGMFHDPWSLSLERISLK